VGRLNMQRRLDPLLSQTFSDIAESPVSLGPAKRSERVSRKAQSLARVRRVVGLSEVLCSSTQEVGLAVALASH
jgi:hypothetical protein